MESLCKDCQKTWNEKELDNVFPGIPDLADRLEPGDQVPVGECPDCGALTFNVPEASNTAPLHEPLFWGCGQCGTTNEVHNPDSDSTCRKCGVVLGVACGEM